MEAYGDDATKRPAAGTGPNRYHHSMSGSSPIGTIAELWRFPVKSMRGESLASVPLTAVGLERDRQFAFASTAAPAGKPLLSGAERTAMLRYTAHADPSPAVTTPGGLTLPLPSPELLAAMQAVARPGERLSLITSPEDPFFDVRPVSLVSTATVRGLAQEFGATIHPLRFRSNLVLALGGERAFAEDTLIGKTLRFGDPGSPESPQLRLLERIPRCRIVSLDPETTVADPDLLRHLARHHGGRIGVYARVVRPGILHKGDPVFATEGPGRVH